MNAILVTGATGKQGGALINALLEHDAPFEILAVTRNTQSGSAQRLAQKSSKVKLVEGNMDDPAAIFARARQLTSSEIWGVYSVQAVIGNGIAGEERQGKALIDESLKQGVKYFVYSSVERGGDSKSSSNPTDIPHFISKHRIEQHLFDSTKNGEMEWTVLRPVAFMDGLTPDFMGKMFATSWRLSLKGKPLQIVATSDIGVFAAEAFQHPDQFAGRSISLAGDNLTFDQANDIFKAKTDRAVPTTFELPCRALLYALGDLGAMFRWFYDEGFGADIAALRKQHTGLKNFATWLDTESAFVER
ncbi:uncharacterized protein PFLUO_LOCUS6109 [Penicillium psychrofluorescens]|uniref:uncharacterized protein n=1 Tax=Penicillium psychrofluorescens TaxID=3158075 RepID=UPI003CCD918A